MTDGGRSGAVAGVAGCTLFLVLHALWIVPIWSVAPVAFVIAAAAGAAFGVLLEGLAPVGAPPTTRIAAALIIAALLLVPSALVAEAGLHVGNATPPAIVAGFFVPTVAVGAALGWVAGRSRSAAGSGALAALLFAIGPGHNIPFLAGTGAVPLELAMLGAVLAISSATLVVVDRVPARGRNAQSSGEPTR